MRPSRSQVSKWQKETHEQQRERKGREDGKELNVFTFDMWYALNRSTN